MKNGWLIWNVLLSLVAGYLLIMHFGSSSKKAATAKNGGAFDSTTGGPFRMAYFEMDSVAANFEMVKEVKAELNKKEEENNAKMDQLAKNFQQRYMYYQNLARSGNLSAAQSDSANQEIKRLDDEMKLIKQQLDQEYNDYMVRRQNDIKTKIEAFLQEYNKTRNYSYIISYEPGLFYYKDTAYNITGDVVKGLNALHKPPVKK